MADIKRIHAGEHYMLAFTQPKYDKYKQQYLPDNFRFVDPEIVHVAYGGKTGKEDPAQCCRICGRKGTTQHMFLNLDTFDEFFISIHCLAHCSTTVWPEDKPRQKIKEWYEREDLIRNAKAGDPLAGLAIAFEEMGE